MKFNIDRSEIGEYLGFVKLGLGMCFIVIGGLVIKFVGAESSPSLIVKIDGGIFVFSAMLLFLSYLMLVNHKKSPNNFVTGKKAFLIILVLASPLVGVLFLYLSLL